MVELSVSGSISLPYMGSFQCSLSVLFTITKKYLLVLVFTFLFFHSNIEIWKVYYLSSLRLISFRS